MLLTKVVVVCAWAAPGTHRPATSTTSRPAAARMNRDRTARPGRAMAGPLSKRRPSAREEPARIDASAAPAPRASAAPGPPRPRRRPGCAGMPAENSSSGEDDSPLAGEAVSGGLRHPLALSRGTTRPGGWHGLGSRLLVIGNPPAPIEGALPVFQDERLVYAPLLATSDTSEVNRATRRASASTGLVTKTIIPLSPFEGHPGGNSPTMRTCAKGHSG